ncbi:hypothetical protein CBF_0937 [Clostridium botulinum F str. 230613]|nr:hypothetical protein CBF_0937 [Clostridium botulinum F str. 230613]
MKIIPPNVGVPAFFLWFIGIPFLMLCPKFNFLNNGIRNKLVIVDNKKLNNTAYIIVLIVNPF